VVTSAGFHYEGKQTLAPPKRSAPKGKSAATTANLGFEAKLWAAADALRNNMDAAEYKHVVLGLIFLKYISDEAFEGKHAELEGSSSRAPIPKTRRVPGAQLFWVPKEARWSHLKANAPQPAIGTIVDDAMTAIERDNPSLKACCPRTTQAGPRQAATGPDHQPGQRHRTRYCWQTEPRITWAGSTSTSSLVSPAPRANPGGQFYTPTHVVRVLVEMLAPYKGRVSDPCCGSGACSFQSEKFIQAHSGKVGRHRDLRPGVQLQTTWRWRR